ncbi:unnamed protein product [Effrenium voratum]|uniref:Uncharacterized protein n=1 Tax=Effrenium voratum TaxID=2562239 RepID=A0AA36NKZ7_9DINO|nr:unnamed protein product [Effrenium voratum]
MAQACLRAEWEATQGEVCGLASHGERNRAETAATQASRVSNRKVDRKSLCLDSQRTTSWISKEVQPLAMISADATAHAAPNGIMTRKRQRALRAASDLAPGSCTDLETETEGSNNPVASQAADGCQDSQVQSLIPKHRPRGPPRGASMTAAAATDPVQPTLVVDAAAHAELPPSGGNVRAADARKRQRVLRAASDLAPGSRTDLETETEGSDNPGASQTADRQIDSQVQSLSHPNVTRATSMTTAAGPAQLADGRLDSLSAAVLSGQAEGTSTLVVDAAAPAAPSGNAGNMHATDARKRQRVLRAASDLAPGSDTEVETETEGSNNPVASQAADCCQDSQVQSLSAPHMARASSVTAAAATDPVQPTLVVDAAAHAAVPPPGNVRATDSRKRQRALRAASDLAPGSCTDVEMGVEGSNSLVASQAADCRQDSQRQSLSAPNMARAASMTAAAATDPVQPTLVADAAAHAAVPPPGNVRPTDSRKRQRALRAASDLAPGSCTDVEMGVEGSNSLVASQAARGRQNSQEKRLGGAASMTAAAATDAVQPTLVVKAVLRTEESNNSVASQAAGGRQDSQAKSLSGAASMTAAAATLQPTLVVDATAHAAVSQAAFGRQGSQVQSLIAPHMARVASMTEAAATDPVQLADSRLDLQANAVSSGQAEGTPTLVDAAAHASITAARSEVPAANASASAMANIPPILSLAEQLVLSQCVSEPGEGPTLPGDPDMASGGSPARSPMPKAKARRLVGKQPPESRAGCLRSGSAILRERIGHILQPRERGFLVRVHGDGWGSAGGAGGAGFLATVTEADALTFTVIRRPGGDTRAWEETHVLRRYCTVVARSASQECNALKGWGS